MNIVTVYVDCTNKNVCKFWSSDRWRGWWMFFVNIGGIGNGKEIQNVLPLVLKKLSKKILSLLRPTWLRDEIQPCTDERIWNGCRA